MVHWPVCLGCFSTRHLRPIAGLSCSQLCLVCRAELDELRRGAQPEPGRSPTLIDITGLFSYEGLIRQLILRTKVGGDLQALQLLLVLAATHPRGQAVLGWADGLMPCASSLWGRVRGRIDIAGQIADHHRRAACPVIAAPLHLHWRWRKQALRQRSHRQVGLQLPEWLIHLGRERCKRTLVRRKTEHLLLIDDVVTSGNTLRHTASELVSQAPGKPGPLIRGLAFAVS